MNKMPPIVKVLCILLMIDPKHIGKEEAERMEGLAGLLVPIALSVGIVLTLYFAFR